MPNGVSQFSGVAFPELRIQAANLVRNGTRYVPSLHKLFLINAPDGNSKCKSAGVVTTATTEGEFQ
jgi:hypothetical protein